MTDREMIEQHLATKGITKCPPGEYEAHSLDDAWHIKKPEAERSGFQYFSVPQQKGDL